MSSFESRKRRERVTQTSELHPVARWTHSLDIFGSQPNHRPHFCSAAEQNLSLGGLGSLWASNFGPNISFCYAKTTTNFRGVVKNFTVPITSFGLFDPEPKRIATGSSVHVSYEQIFGGVITQSSYRLSISVLVENKIAVHYFRPKYN